MNLQNNRRDVENVYRIRQKSQASLQSNLRVTV